MDFLQVVILSIIEAITEFLPISSTGHMILASHILDVPQGKILATFEIAIQIGPIAAISFLYYKKLLKEKDLLLKSFVGFIPTGILGITLYPYIKPLLQNELVTIAALLIGGFAILIIEWIFDKKIQSNTKNLYDLSYKDAFGIGLIQSLAMIPGVSRSASSIFGGMALKLNRKSAVEFSFFLAIPTMIAATSFDIFKNASTLSNNDFLMITIGIIISFVVAIAIVKWFLKYIKNNNFFWFGIYRIVFAIFYALLFLK